MNSHDMIFAQQSQTVNRQPGISYVQLSLIYVGRGNSAIKIDTQLVQGLSPVPAGSGPFFCDIAHSQIQDFEQCIVRRKDGLGLRYLAELAVEILYRIRGINDFAYLRRILEICRQLRPVVSP